MNSEKFFFYLQTGTVGAIVLIAAFASYDYFARPVSRAAPYFFIRDAVEERIAPRKVSRFISPSDLRLEPLDEKQARASGWVEYTNGLGQTSTQWFNCVVGFHRKSHGISKLQMFRQEPSKNR